MENIRRLQWRQEARPLEPTRLALCQWRIIDVGQSKAPPGAWFEKQEELADVLVSGSACSLICSLFFRVARLVPVSYEISNRGHFAPCRSSMWPVPEKEAAASWQLGLRWRDDVQGRWFR